ncbi:MAG: hypothetical protein ACP5VS_01150 [Desulfomonilaceae bacterium]
MNIEYITSLFLIAVFILAEIYRAKRSARGIIVSVEDLGPQNFLGEIRTAVVKLKSGQEVTAKLTQCAACIAKIQVGSEVRVFNSSDGYTVDPVWFLSKKSCGFYENFCDR